jgi:hypothetical protein
MDQHEVTKPTELLGGDGRLVEEGWARRPFWRYDRSRIAAPRWRIKEWDYYSILSHGGKYGLCLTISDLGYLGMAALAWIDFAGGKAYQLDDLFFFPMGKIGFPPVPGEGSVSHKSAKMELSFQAKDGRRRLKAKAPGFPAPDGGSGLEAEIELAEIPGGDSMNIATSWAENRKAFYYNTKINCMAASGKVRLGSADYAFSPADSAGGLDWGRGVWTYKNRWYWGSASGLLDGVPFGWNIGYGFSDRSPASENMVFYGGKAHKLGEVSFHIDASNYLAPWKFTSSDGRFELDFQPAVDRSGSTDILLIKSIQHQVFGYFSGKIVLDDGKVLKLDRFMGFAEDVINWW